jgi:large subunit ribosomal protein L35
MPKNKTHSGAKKRIRITGTGKLRAQRSGLRHNFEHKSSRVTRRLAGTSEVAPADARRLKRLLGR